MKSNKIFIIIFCVLMLTYATNVEAQPKKKIWDSAKKAWVWVEENVAKNANGKSRHKVRSHIVTVDCNQCSGYGKVKVTIPVIVWNPYYQCYQTQYQTQIQVCNKCLGSGKVRKEVYF